MLYQRQKIALALLEALGGFANATDFQKLLFLYTQLCEKEKSYDFIPYRFGCYSFQSAVDKSKLADRGYLIDEPGWRISKKNQNHFSVLTPQDARKIKIFTERYGHLRGNQLIKHVYRNYPYFAINSEISAELLNGDEMEKVQLSKPKKRRKREFATIGYEGGSIESYLNTLIKHDIRMLVDVRKNPISRKYGFSKRTLASLASSVGIEYEHLPELGIESNDRRGLTTTKEYERLFDKYEKTVLRNEIDALHRLIHFHKVHRRIAITCFEKEHYLCHRDRVATAIETMTDGEVRAVHI